MALTPEDVVNKRFQHVKFRDGYDQDEVDDFLDEVVVELRRLYQENDELRQKLSAAEQRVSENNQGAATAPAVADEDPQATQAMPAAVPGNAPAEAPRTQDSAPSPLVAPQAPATEAPSAPEVEEAPAAPAAQASSSPLGPQSSDAPQGSALTANSVAGDDNDAHGLISLAQRLHDEHIAEGKQTRDKLISEARAKAGKIVSDAEKKRDSTLSQLESQKSSLEREIDGLQNFERQYRTRLKSYLTDQLRDLENSGSLAPETLAGGAAATNAKHSL